MAEYRFIARSQLHTAALLGITIILLIGHTSYAADDPVITAVEPASIQQGDTVMLTITGNSIPTGSVVVEFFPQQIALLDVLSADAEEVAIQIKVPSLAQPGKYNILVYNQLGEELFAEGMLEISSQVITPVFRDYQPKSIGDATEGFALLLTGESITPDVIEHLSMQWTLSNTKLDKLNTIFSYGSHGQVLCAVTGQIPGGLLQGKIELDGTPIYMVEIHNQTVQAMIVGQQPTILASDQEQYVVNLLGTDISPAYVDSLGVSLESETLSSKASSIKYIDSTTFQIIFHGPLPAADYSLKVVHLDNVLFTGNLLLTAHEATEGQVEIESNSAMDSDHADTSQATDVSSAFPVENNNDMNAVKADIFDLTPTSINPGPDPSSFAFTSTGISADQYDRLVVELQIGGQKCQLLFMGAGRDNCTCLFSAPTGGWINGTAGTFTVSDPLGEIEDFAADVLVSDTSSEVTQSSEATGEFMNTEDYSPAIVSREVPVISVANEENLGFRIDLINGTLTPDSMSIKLATSATDGFDQDQIGVSFTPSPEKPKSAYFMQHAGGSITILVDLTAWRIEELAEGLLLKLNSSSEVVWEDGAELRIQNLSTETHVASQEFEIDKKCLVSNSGFRLKVFLSENSKTRFDLDSAVFDCDDALLKINLDKFSRSVERVDPTDGRVYLEFRFERDDEVLDVIAYWLLMEQLIDSQGTGVNLGWPDLGLTASADVLFIRDN